MSIVLTVSELAELDRQNPATKGDGGWQRLLVCLQEKVNRTSREVVLTAEDIQRISAYAFDYGRGGWENRLALVFGRTLGPNLGRLNRVA